MRRGFKAWAERKAASFRRELRIPWLAPLRAATLAEYLGVLIIEPEAIPGVGIELLQRLELEFGYCWSAVTISMEQLTVIVCNPTHGEGRRESDIMHELAHLICQHPPVRITTIPGGFRLRSFSQEAEEEAAWLGSVLQIPRAALLTLSRRGYSVDALAEHFHASEQMVRFRRNMTGVGKLVSQKA